jgi:hypothetical protein
VPFRRSSLAAKCTGHGSVGDTDGDAVGSEVVGDTDGDMVGSEVVGAIELGLQHRRWSAASSEPTAQPRPVVKL